MVHSIIPVVEKWGIGALTLHGRTRQQRYSKTADWNYIQQCASLRGDQGKLQVNPTEELFSHPLVSPEFVCVCLTF